MFSGDKHKDLYFRSLEEAESRIMELESYLIEKNKEISSLKSEMANLGSEFRNEVKANQNRYISLFEKIRTIMLIIDPSDGTIINANPAACDFYGYTIHEMKNMKIYDINALSIDDIRSEMTSARLQQRNYFQFPHRLKNGDIKIVEVYSGPIQNEDSTLLVSIIHDITERIKTEDAYLETLRRNQALLNAIPDIVFTIDRNGFYTDFRPDVLNRRGLKPDKIIGSHVCESGFSVDTSKLIVQAVDNVLLTNNIMHLKYEYVTQSGNTIYYSCRIVKLNDNEVMGIAHDITDEVNIEEELINSHRRNRLLHKEIDLRFNVERQLKFNESLLKAVTNSTPHAYYVVDQETNDILYYNQIFCNIWRLSPLEQMIASGSLKHNDILSLCMPLVDDIPHFIGLMTDRTSNNEKPGYKADINLIDGRLVKFYSTNLSEEGDSHKRKLYIFEEEY